MRADNVLRLRYVERQQWLARMTQLLWADRTLAAAWLAGSLGRGDEDDLSDIDLWVIVADTFISGVLSNPHGFVGRFEKPILLEAAPQNAPPGGAYVLALYARETGPLQVDWYWQQVSDARIPPDARLLFDRVGIRSADLPVPPVGAERAELLAAKVAFQWAMLSIAAKKVARRHSRAALAMIGTIERTIAEMQWLCGGRDTPPSYKDECTAPPPTEPAAQLATLRALADATHTLHPHLIRLGVATPDEAVAQVYRFFDLVSMMLERTVLPQEGEPYAP